MLFLSLEYMLKNIDQNFWFNFLSSLMIRSKAYFSQSIIFLILICILGRGLASRNHFDYMKHLGNTLSEASLQVFLDMLCIVPVFSGCSFNFIAPVGLPNIILDPIIPHFCSNFDKHDFEFHHSFHSSGEQGSWRNKTKGYCYQHTDDCTQ